MSTLPHLHTFTGPFKPTPYDEDLAKLKSYVEEALTKSNEEYGWVPISHPHNKITSFSKVLEGTPVPFLKSTTTFPSDIESMRRLLAHLDFRALWDDRFEGHDLVEIVDPGTVLCRVQFRAPWPVSSRDMSIIVRTEPITNPFDASSTELDSFLITSKSVLDDRMPENSGAVRGIVDVVGYFLTKNKENPLHTDIVYVLAINPCGSIPGFIIKGLTMGLTDCLNGIHQLLENNPTKVDEINTSYAEKIIKH